MSTSIGETEKNLARLFDQPRARGRVLFFDEVDALFSWRTEVREARCRTGILDAVAPSPSPRERWAALRRLEDHLETPLAVAGIAWLVLLVVELAMGLPTWLEVLGFVLWALFVVEFLLRLALAPVKGAFLRANWLTLLSLVVPVLRVFRAFRAFRAVRAVGALRGARLLRVLGAVNRGLATLRRVLHRHRFGYVVAGTAAVVLVVGAAVSAIEREADPRAPLADLGTSLWWGAMMVTTMGADVFPRTGEGRILALLLAIYGFAVFGYITATVAVLFLERPAGAVDDAGAIRREIAALREQVQRLLERDR